MVPAVGGPCLAAPLPDPHVWPPLYFMQVMTGLTGLFGLGMTYGGPVAVIWGWCAACQL